MVKSGKFNLLGNECSVRNGRIKRVPKAAYRDSEKNHTCPASFYIVSVNVAGAAERRVSTKGIIDLVNP